MAVTFNYFDEWEKTPLTCDRCAWSGLIEKDRLEDRHESCDFSCPACSQLIAMVVYPTETELILNWNKLPESEKQIYSQQAELRAAYAACHLGSPSQLPDLESDAIVLVWDFGMVFENRVGREHVLIKHEGCTIWYEPAFYECIERFGEVVDILLQKYGERLKDLIPSAASKTYLEGDDLSAWSKLKKLHAKMAPDSVDEATGLQALAQAGDQQALNRLRYEREISEHHLSCPEQLPDIVMQEITVSLDIAENLPRVTARQEPYGISYEWAEESGDGFLYAVLSHQGKELWREAAHTGQAWPNDYNLDYELAARYAEFARVLRLKYRARLRVLDITDRSYAYIGRFLSEELRELQKQFDLG